MADLYLGRFFAELTPDVRHAFTGPEDGTSPTKIKGSHWNAAHVAPRFEFGAFPGAMVASVSAGTTEINTDARWKGRISSIASIRIQAYVSQAVAGAALVLQYTTDLTGATGWTSLGASLSCASTGPNDSASVAPDSAAVTASASADILFRWVITA